jgi:hypothetical protein
MLPARHCAFLGDRLRLAQPDVDLGADQHDADQEKERADRAVDEGHEVTAGNQQGATEILLEARTEYESKQHRRRMEVEAQQHVADKPADDAEPAEPLRVVGQEFPLSGSEEASAVPGIRIPIKASAVPSMTGMNPGPILARVPNL